MPAWRMNPQTGQMEYVDPVTGQVLPPPQGNPAGMTMLGRMGNPANVPDLPTPGLDARRALMERNVAQMQGAVPGNRGSVNDLIAMVQRETVPQRRSGGAVDPLSPLANYPTDMPQQSALAQMLAGPSPMERARGLSGTVTPQGNMITERNGRMVMMPTSGRESGRVIADRTLAQQQERLGPQVERMRARHAATDAKRQEFADRRKSLSEMLKVAGNDGASNPVHAIAQARGIGQALIRSGVNPQTSQQIALTVLEQQLKANQPMSPLEQAQLEREKAQTSLAQHQLDMSQKSVPETRVTSLLGEQPTPESIQATLRWMGTTMTPEQASERLLENGVSPQLLAQLNEPFAKQVLASMQQRGLYNPPPTEAPPLVARALFGENTAEQDARKKRVDRRRVEAWGPQGPPTSLWDAIRRGFTEEM